METKTKKPKVKNIRGGKLLLKFLEETDLWEWWDSTGLCLFAKKLYERCQIDSNQYSQVWRFMYYNNPNKSPYSVYWFKMGDKQARINHLRKLLYDNTRTT